MPVILTDPDDDISTIHIAERLESNLLLANENVEDMELIVYFNVETRLPNGKLISQPYWDSKPLKLTCKNNSELAEAMRVIQQAIGLGRYQQMIAPILEPVENLEMIPPTENS